jgi:3-oxoadipate enol-lactonase
VSAVPVHRIVTDPDDAPVVLLPNSLGSTLAVAGANDPATPPPHLAAIADSVLDGRLLVVPDAAHLANAQQPDSITPAIIEHLTKESA